VPQKRIAIAATVLGASDCSGQKHVRPTTLPTWRPKFIENASRERGEIISGVAGLSVSVADLSEDSDVEQ
jgi:hypothetical protein